MPPRNPADCSVEDIAQAIRDAWLRGDITQKQVKRDLGIHQSQFSKLVNGQFKEATGHALRLFEYSTQRERANRLESHDKDADALKSALTERLMHAWDGTRDGARALEAILDGVARLRVGASRRR